MVRFRLSGMFPGVRIPEYFVKLYNLIILDKLQCQKETFGSKARSCVHFEKKMSFYRADIDHLWPLSFTQRNIFFTLWSPLESLCAQTYAYDTVYINCTYRIHKFGKQANARVGNSVISFVLKSLKHTN